MSGTLSSIRQRLNHAGSDQRQLDVLRRTLAASEDPRVLRALAVAASELWAPPAGAAEAAPDGVKSRWVEEGPEPW
jgi:hypothetical protein